MSKSRRAAELRRESPIKQSLPHTPEKTHHEPDVHWESVPDALRGAVDDLLEEYNA